MPVQKGKRRRRPRRRGAPLEDYEPQAATSTSPPKGTARPIMRRGWQAPLWANLAIGFFLAVSGAFFFLFPGKGAGSGQRLLFLLLYFALAGLYLGKAIRQWMQKRRQ